MLAEERDSNGAGCRVGARRARGTRQHMSLWCGEEGVDVGNSCKDQYKMGQVPAI